MRKLIVNADDFGLHVSVNRAVESAYQSGIVRSTSIMAVGEAFEDAVRVAKSLPGIGVGVHLTLVAAQPLSSRESVSSLLADDGRFLSGHPTFIRRYMAGRIALVEVERELSAQVRRVVESGICPTHVDSHQHLHVLPGIGCVVLELARKFGISAVRIPAEPLLFVGGTHFGTGRLLGRTGLTLMSRRFRKMAVLQGFAVTDHFFGMLAGGCMTLPRINKVLQQLPVGVSELMVHPGQSNSVLSGRFPWGYCWQEELQALTAQEVSSLCDSLGILSASYRDFSI